MSASVFNKSKNLLTVIRLFLPSFPQCSNSLYLVVFALSILNSQSFKMFMLLLEELNKSETDLCMVIDKIVAVLASWNKGRVLYSGWDRFGL